ncbi:cell surface protein [Bifidobacterium myosotis]|uniref:Cell surface protein n=1 Tax=Bifidobacterium myosotis TaxID=1630166 RepID=A0A261FQW2_9BIFI|nr:hypothetical protein [Bifidobacterium myosotis]OZG61581.1 cell surface protein [Bifidobacterium myosotis]
MFTHWMPAQWRRRSIASLITLLTLTLLLALIITPTPSHADSSSPNECAKSIESDNTVEPGLSDKSEDTVPVPIAMGPYISPIVSTRVKDKAVDSESPIIDEVTSALLNSDIGWPVGLELRASGYYFEGIESNNLGTIISPETGESTSDFLARLAIEGYVPAAYGEACFTSAGQTVEAQAMTELGGTKPYFARKYGDFGTWVWAFERSRQSAGAQEYLEKDWTSSFMDDAETNSIRAPIEVTSEVSEHIVEVGASLNDTITVSGFPEDHGTFAGNGEYGFGADEPYAQISVWWAGDPDNPANDAMYEPSGSGIPEEDRNHELVTQWNVRAVNGTYSLDKGRVDGSETPVSVIAKKHGWYVFVWSFKGDDRAMPVSSSYDDPAERVFVVEPEAEEEPEEPREEIDEPEEPDKEESEDEEIEGTVQKTVAGPKQLGKTGSGVLLVTGIGVAVLSVGAIMLVAIKRRSL